jgi:cytoskeletal protein CcmA (bactofilin family)
MFSSSDKKSKPVTGVTTLIGPGTVVRGDVSFSGGLHLDGKVEGAVRTDGSTNAVLTLSEKGEVIGEIQVPNVVVNGSVKGDITASERLELAAQARIDGNVYYKVLEMAAGAQINGKMVYQPEPPKQLPKPEVKAGEPPDDSKSQDEAKNKSKDDDKPKAKS